MIFIATEQSWKFWKLLKVYILMIGKLRFSDKNNCDFVVIIIDSRYLQTLQTPTVRASVGDETFLTGIGVLKTTWYIFLNIILQISGVGTPSDWVFDHPLIYIAFGPHSLYERVKIRVLGLSERVIDQIIMLPPKKFRKILNFVTQGGRNPIFTIPPVYGPNGSRFRTLEQYTPYFDPIW